MPRGRRGAATGWLQGQAGAPTLHPAGLGPGLGQRLGHHVAARAVGHGHQGAGRSGVVGEPGPTQDHGGTDVLGHAPFEGGPRGRRLVQVAGRRWPTASGRRPPRARRAASSMVCHPVHRHRWASRAWSIWLGHRSTGPGPSQGGQPHDDARGAEAALAAAGGHQGVRPPVPLRGREPVERGHLATLEAADRGDAGHPGGPVHPHRAAAALALGAAPVLDRADAQLVAQDIEERGPSSATSTSTPSTRSRISGSAAQLNEEPQPQVREALGLVTWNPAPCSPSL